MNCSLSSLWCLLRHLKTTNARQKRAKGRLGDVTTEQRLEQIRVKAEELGRGLPGEKVRLGELLTAVLHYAQLRGYDEPTLASAAVTKLNAGYQVKDVRPANTLAEMTLSDSGELNTPDLAVRLDGTCQALDIYVEGFGSAAAMPGYGPIALLEIWEGELRLVVWADVNEEDPTHTIILDGARESQRKEQ